MMIKNIKYSLVYLCLVYFLETYKLFCSDHTFHMTCQWRNSCQWNFRRTNSNVALVEFALVEFALRKDPLYFILFHFLNKVVFLCLLYNKGLNKQNSATKFSVLTPKRSPKLGVICQSKNCKGILLIVVPYCTISLMGYCTINRETPPYIYAYIHWG